MAKRVLALLLCICICFLLSACSKPSFEISNMISAPSPSGEMENIENALKKSKGENIVLKYPRSGKYRSPFILRDIDGDGTQEAVAFYSTPKEDGKNTLHINLLAKTDREWKSVSDIGLTADSVDRVDFRDFCDSGSDQIVVGWNCFSEDNRRLTVFRVEGRTLLQLSDENYSTFALADMDRDGLDEIVSLYIDRTGKQAGASLTKIVGNRVELLSTCRLDGSATEYHEPVVAETDGKGTAVYFDAESGSSGSFTQLLQFENGVLFDAFFDAQSGQNTVKRPISLKVHDCNGDKIPEIPCTKYLPSLEGYPDSRNMYIIQWSTYGSEGFTPVKNTYINNVDGYKLNIPSEWADNIIAIRSSSGSSCVFYEYAAGAESPGDEILSVTVVTGEVAGIDTSSFVLDEGDGKTYYGHLGTSKLAPDEKEFKKSFKRNGGKQS